MVYTSTFTRSLLTASGLLFGTMSIAQTEAKPETKPAKAILKSTLRVHSDGMFSYGGRIACHNPVADINFTYEYNGWGTQLFKATDLKAGESPYNFMMLSVYKTIKLSPRLTFTPYAAAFFEQEHGFADAGSDIGLITLTAWKADKHITVDHTMLIGNLVVDPKDRDWVNRFRFLYSNKHLDITLMAWHNNPVFDHVQYASGAISIGYSRIKLSRQFMLSIMATEMGMVASSDEIEYPRNNRLVITTSIQFNRS